MTGTELVNEIAEILEEDFSLNQVWSRAKLHDFISQDFHDMARQTEASHELVALTVYPSGDIVLLTDTTSGVFFARTTTYDIPTGTFSDADLLTGVTNPMSSGTPQMCVWEHGEYVREAQDTGDYTEVDVPGRVALTDATTVTVTDLDNDEEVWVVKDRGVDYYNGYFESYVDLKCTAATAGGERVACWALANTVDTLKDIDTANGDYLAVYWDSQFIGESIEIKECNGGATDSHSWAVSKDTDYYLRIVRDESVGTYGTLYCYIYTDSTRVTLVSTISLALTEKQDFRYLYWLNTLELGTSGHAWSGVISNLKTTSTGFCAPTLRFMPRFSASGTTVVVYAQTGVTTSQTIGDTIQARPIFMVLLKYLGLRDAYSMDSLLKDPSKSKTFGALADVVQGALKSLYGGRR